MTDPCNDSFNPCSEVPDPDVCRRAGQPGQITLDDVRCAQQQWCDGLIDISQEYKNNPNGEKYREMAAAFIRRLYDFGPGGRVFFRPTLAEFPCNFRTTFEGTFAYFVGDVPGFPDTGFARKHLIAAHYSNKIEGRDGREAILIGNGSAWAMGNVCLTEVVNKIETSVVVDKVFVYRKIGTELKLMVHMSALRNESGKKAVE